MKSSCVSDYEMIIMNLVMKTIGERVKNRRKELGWTLAEVSSKSGLSKGFLSDLENNKRKSPNGNTLGSLSEALSLTVDFLLTGRGKLSEPDAPIDIPLSLSAFAQVEGLSFSHTLMLLQLRKQILAFRSESKSEDLDDFDWKPFYEAVKSHLK